MSEWTTHSFCKRIFREMRGAQMGNHGAGAHWMRTLREMSDFHYYGTFYWGLWDTCERMLRKRASLSIRPRWGAWMGAHLPGILRDRWRRPLEKALLFREDLEGGLLFSRGHECWVKESPSLSIGASLWYVQGFLYRRLWKTTKIVLRKRIALPIGILRAEPRSRAPLLGNLKDK